MVRVAAASRGTTRSRGCTMQCSSVHRRSSTAGHRRRRPVAGGHRAALSSFPSTDSLLAPLSFLPAPRQMPPSAITGGRRCRHATSAVIPPRWVRFALKSQSCDVKRVMSFLLPGVTADEKEEYETSATTTSGGKINSNDVHQFSHLLGVGSIEEVHVARDKGFDFVKHSTNEEAALAIQTGNGQLISSRQIKGASVRFSVSPSRTSRRRIVLVIIATTRGVNGVVESAVVEKNHIFSEHAPLCL